MRINSGTRIKDLAKVLGWLGSIISVIAGIILAVIAFDTPHGDDFGIMGYVILIGIGIFLSYIGFSILDAFGSLVDNSFLIAEKLLDKNNSKEDTPNSDDN